MSKKVFAVIGDPITHSLSPLLHQTAFNALKIRANYVGFQVKKEELPCFMEFFSGMRDHDFVPLSYDMEAKKLVPIADIADNKEKIDVGQKNPIQGLSVTLPHKKEIMAYADELTPMAELVGAANTLYYDRGKLIAHNTDVGGFLAPLSPFYVIEHPEFGSPKPGDPNYIRPRVPATKAHSALVLGAGGAAAAALVGLLHLPSIENIYLCARRKEQAEEVLSHLKAKMREMDLEKRIPNLSQKFLEYVPYEEREMPADLVVNTIPATLQGKSFTPRQFFRKNSIAYDLLYAFTPFLQKAENDGAHIISGQEMFLGQGSMQFYLWTKEFLPREASLAVQRAIAKR